MEVVQGLSRPAMPAVFYPKTQARLLALASSIAVILIGVTVLAGWAVHSPTLKGVLPAWSTMKVNTALGFVFSGCALWLLVPAPTDSRRGIFEQRTAQVLAVLIGLLGLISIGEELWAWSPGIDQFFAHDADPQSVHPGRMSFPTAVCFCITSVALLWQSYASAWRYHAMVLQALASVLLAAALLSLGGYLAGAAVGYQLWDLSGMAVHTAFAYLIVGTGLIAISVAEDGLNWSLGRAITITYAIGLLALVLLNGISHRSIRQLVEANALAVRVAEVRFRGSELLSGVQDVQLGQRGYTITGDDLFLEDFRAGLSAIDVNLSILRELTRDMPVQQRQLRHLDPLIAARLEFANAVIDARRRYGFEQAAKMVATGKGRELTIRIRTIIAEIDREQQQRGAEITAAVKLATDGTLLILPVGTYISLLFLSLVLFLLNREGAERARAANAQARIAAIVESSSNPIFSITLDGIVTSWNRAAHALFGYSAAEMIGLPMKRLIPADRVDEAASILASLKTGNRIEHFETLRIAKDGRQIPVSLTASPINDEAGQVVGVSKIIYDISERRRSEDALSEAKTRLQVVTENLQEGLVISDSEGHLLQWNAQALRMHGFTSSEEGNRHFNEFATIFEVSHTDGSALLPRQWPLARVLGGETLRNVEVLLHRPRTDWQRTFNFNGSIEQYAPGKRLAFVTITDITERKQAEKALQEAAVNLELRVIERTAQLESAYNDLEAFSYSVSHDLRAPLRAMDGFARNLVHDYGSALGPEGSRKLNIVRKSAQQMGLLINDILAFSHTGRAQMNTASVDMNELLRGVVEELSADSHGARYTMGQLPAARGDRSMLKQVFVNLISNAIKYSYPKGPPLIEVGAITKSAEVIYFVRDHGVGFDMRYVEKLFGVFQRLHSAAEFEGTGIGLAIVKRIVTRHGGQVWAESVLGEGTNISFSLPNAESHDASLH
jgi:PAS domain S-box-containing protein